jgi:hypothetical protein
LFGQQHQLPIVARNLSRELGRIARDFLKLPDCRLGQGNGDTLQPLYQVRDQAADYVILEAAQHGG